MLGERTDDIVFLLSVSCILYEIWGDFCIFKTHFEFLFSSKVHLFCIVPVCKFAVVVEQNIFFCKFDARSQHFSHLIEGMLIVWSVIEISLYILDSDFVTRVLSQF